MINFLNKFIKTTNNLDYISQNFKSLSKNPPIKKIFDLINDFSLSSEIRYVGGCVRKIIQKEKVDDIDLATNLNPHQVSEILKNNNISYYETGIEHGTITAIIEDYKFEITSLREDVKTDGRRAVVKFSTDWKKDASRRDFTINSIYSDIDGNLFDPFNGKKDLENGVIKFIGNTEKRIKEDYLRIIRYLRFFLIYSNHEHNQETLKVIRRNLGGISNLSKERLLDELKKCVKSNVLTKLSKNQSSTDLFLSIFPQIKKIKYFSNPNTFAKKKLQEADFIFILSLLIIDGTDNTDYFFFKFNISKKNQKRLKIIDEFYRSQFSATSFSEKNLNKILYFKGKQAVIDILSYRMFTAKKEDKKLLNLIDQFNSKILPAMPVVAKDLIEKYHIPESKDLGSKLKLIEEKWVNNNFQLSSKQIDEIVNH